MNTQVNEAVKNATQGTTENKAPNLFDVNTKEVFNPTVRDKVHSLLRTQMRTGEGLYKQLFLLIREAGDFSTASGSIHGAEVQLCKDEKVKNLNQLNKQRDMALSSYITVKNVLLGAIKDADDLCTNLQALWDWEEQHEGAEKRILPKDYLDAFSDRYSDPVKCAATFRKDANLAKAASATLQQKQAAYERTKARAEEQANQRAAAAGTLQETPAQVRSGGGQADIKLPEPWTNALNNLKSTLARLGRKDDKPFQESDYGKKVPQCIERAEQAIAQLYKDYSESIKVKASEHAARPSEAVAATQRTQEEPVLPDVTGDELSDEDKKNIAEIEGQDATGTGE